MTEYLKDLRNRAPGDPAPPVNLGPYDNPLLWNKLDPFGADRGHQRRPMSISRDMMELYQIPPEFRDHCVHRVLPLFICFTHVQPMTIGTPNCSEFHESWALCRANELYRLELLKQKFIKMTENYTLEDKRFFPTVSRISTLIGVTDFYWTIVASQRLSGWDERDPANPMMNRQPNRALMRANFSPTMYEEGLMTAELGPKLLPDDYVYKQLPSFPLPEDKRPI